MRIAVSRDGKTVEEPRRIETPVNDFEEGIRRIVSAARELAGGEKITAAAGGVAGPFDASHTTLLSSPHILAWAGKPLRESLEKELGVSVYLENDTALVGLGEATVGAGVGFSIVAYITVSTGVGGVRIVSGSMDKNAFGFEVGHQIVDAGDSLGGVSCSQCGHKGELESFISGTAFTKKYNKKPNEVMDPAVWNQAARILAYGLYNTILHWSPHVVVLGGPMMVGNPAIPFDAVETNLTQLMKIFPTLPVLKKAELGDVGGLHGALAYVQKKL